VLEPTRVRTRGGTWALAVLLGRAAWRRASGRFVSAASGTAAAAATWSTTFSIVGKLGPTHLPVAVAVAAVTHVAVFVPIPLPLAITNLALTFAGNAVSLSVPLSLALPVLALVLCWRRVGGWSRSGQSGGRNGPVGELLGEARKLVFVAQTNGLVGGLELVERLTDVVEFVDLCVDWNDVSEDKGERRGDPLFASYSSRCSLSAITSRWDSS
jgi:hypothetical protein